MFRIDSAASSGGQEKLTYFMYFSSPPPEARLSIQRFVSYLLVANNHVGLQKNSQHHALVSTAFNVC